MPINFQIFYKYLNFTVLSMKGIVNLKLEIATVLLVIVIDLIIISQVGLINHNRAEALRVVSVKQIRGGGNGSILCPDSSSKQASIAFFAYINNSGQLSTGRWSINEINNPENSVPGFASGSFDSVDSSANTYTLLGKKLYEAALCSPPISIPVAFSAVCGQHVTINVKFESNDPLLKTGGSFTGDVTCNFS